MVSSTVLLIQREHARFSPDAQAGNLTITACRNQFLPVIFLIFVSIVLPGSGRTGKMEPGGNFRGHKSGLRLFGDWDEWRIGLCNRL